MKNTFFCVQPILIDVDLILELFDLSYNIDYIDSISQELPEWITDINNKNILNYQNIHSLKLPEIDTSLLSDFFLYEYLNMEDTKFYLLFDSDLNSFTLCYELAFDFNKLSYTEILDLINYSDECIYTTIHKVFNKSKWYEEIVTEAKYKIKRLLEDFLDSFDIAALTVNYSASSITNLIDFSDSDLVQSKITDAFIKKNTSFDSSEYLIKNHYKLPYGDTYFAGDYYNTVSINRERNLNKYFSYSYQISNSIHYLYTLSEIYLYLNKNILLSKSSSINTKIRNMNALIGVINLFTLKNKSFKSSFRKSIYNELEENSSVHQLFNLVSSYSKEYSKKINLENKNLLEFEKISEYKKEKRAISDDKEQRLLTEFGHKDVLTRSYNRKKFYNDIKDKKYDSFYLSFIDIDKLKKITDLYGHDCRDEVLKRIVDIIYSVIKDSDFDISLYRFGIEEFLISVYDKDKYSVLGILNQIKDLIDSDTIEYNGENIYFSVSIGSVKSEGDNIEELVEKAYSYAYKSREENKNRISYSF